MAVKNPLRIQAYELWKASKGRKKLTKIAVELDVSASLVRKWKCEDAWETRRKSGMGAPKGNKNAVGRQKGESGAKPGNKNSVVTGAYEKIFLDVLTEEETDMVERMTADPMSQIDLEIKLLTIRERRMMDRINIMYEQKEDIEEEILSIVRTVPKREAFEKGGAIKPEIMATLVPQEVRQRKKSVDDKLTRIEAALTGVQEKKIKAVELKHKMMLSPIVADATGGDTVQFIFERGKVDAEYSTEDSPTL